MSTFVIFPLLLASVVIPWPASARPQTDSGYEEIALDPVYNYGFTVVAEDDDTGAVHQQSFTQIEDRDGDETHGEYRIDLADGRTLVVSYEVVGDSGFVANVYYEGEAATDPPPTVRKTEATTRAPRVEVAELSEHDDVAFNPFG